MTERRQPFILRIKTRRDGAVKAHTFLLMQCMPVMLLHETKDCNGEAEGQKSLLALPSTHGE